MNVVWVDENVLWPDSACPGAFLVHETFKARDIGWTILKSSDLSFDYPEHNRIKVRPGEAFTVRSQSLALLLTLFSLLFRNY